MMECKSHQVQRLKAVFDKISAEHNARWAGKMQIVWGSKSDDYAATAKAGRWYDGLLSFFDRSYEIRVIPVDWSEISTTFANPLILPQADARSLYNVLCSCKAPSTLDVLQRKQSTWWVFLLGSPWICCRPQACLVF
jgi:hypothetical protein